LSDPINYLGEIICTSDSSINKTDRHDIAEILLKMALNTIISLLPPQGIINKD
jgi:hypothetical protein